MRTRQIEGWVISIIDRLVEGQIIEDSRVELKANWPDTPQRAARRIAGHANAARGDVILWIIGVDEKARTVVGANANDLASWYSSVRAEFDSQLAPTLYDLAVPYDGKTVIALLFETDRAPFVVKNPSRGNKGEVVQWEVPWRDHTSIRSATRTDLLRLLTPKQNLPTFELLSASLECDNRADAAKLQWRIAVKAYIVTTASEPVVLPFHRCTGLLAVESWMPPTPLARIYLHPEGDHSSLIKKAASEVIVDTAGTLQINALLETAIPYPLKRGLPAQIQFALQPAKIDTAVTLDITLLLLKFDITPQDNSPHNRIDATWIYRRDV